MSIEKSSRVPLGTTLGVQEMPLTLEHGSTDLQTAVLHLAAAINAVQKAVDTLDAKVNPRVKIFSEPSDPEAASRALAEARQHLAKALDAIGAKSG